MRNPLDIIWFQRQFDEIRARDLLLAGNVEEVKKLCTLILAEGAKTRDDVIPELEAAISRVWAQAIKIDSKVPDKNVPPGSTTPNPAKSRDCGTEQET